MIKEVVGMSYLEPLSDKHANLLIKLAEKSLKSALFVACGYYNVDKTEAKLPSGIKLKSEDFCRKYGWKATEHSVSCHLNIILTSKEESIQFQGH